MLLNPLPVSKPAASPSASRAAVPNIAIASLKAMLCRVTSVRSLLFPGFPRDKCRFRVAFSNRPMQFRSHVASPPSGDGFFGRLPEIQCRPSLPRPSLEAFAQRSPMSCG